MFFQVKQQTENKTTQHQPHCSLPESAGAGEGSLFLGRLDQGRLVGNAESTHVNRPKGKAPQQVKLANLAMLRVHPGARGTDYQRGVCWQHRD